jgi:hypothetical protein
VCVSLCINLFNFRWPEPILIKLGMHILALDPIPISLSVWMCISLSLLGNDCINVTAAMNTCITIEIMLDASFSIDLCRIKRNKAIRSSQEFVTLFVMYSSRNVVCTIFFISIVNLGRNYVYARRIASGAGKRSRQDESWVEVHVEQSGSAQDTATTRNTWSIDAHSGLTTNY